VYEQALGADAPMLSVQMNFELASESRDPALAPVAVG
jgi:hypothetical protein